MTFPGRVGRILYQLMLVVFCLLGAGTVAVMALGAVDDIRVGLASRDWPGLPGTIESSWVEERRKGDDIPHISYRYVFEGSVLRSDEVGAWGPHADAGQLVATYPVGADVIVYRDPDSGVTVLGRGVDGESWAALILGALLLPILAGAAGWFLLEGLPLLGLRRPFGLDRLFVPKPPPVALPQVGDAARKAQADQAMEAEIAERLRLKRLRERRERRR